MITQPENQPQERVQAIRSVYKTITPNTTASIATTESEVVHVTVYLDSVGRDIAFWEDILFAFKDALNVRRGTHVLPLLRGSNYKLYVFHSFALFIPPLGLTNSHSQLRTNMADKTLFLSAYA